MLQLTHLYVKNFRCFSEKRIDFTSKVVVLAGDNGSGKTSLLESVHYLCYLRSFKTYSPKELVRFGESSFFIKALFASDHDATHEIQVGLSGAKRLVKLDQKAICSYKDLMNHYRIVTLTEDDLQLVKGTPDVRRTFIDQVILLNDQDFIETIRSFRHTLDNRNALIQQGTIHKDSSMIWSRQLYEKSQAIQMLRIKWLETLANRVKQLGHDHFGDTLSITFEYTFKKGSLEESFDDFIAKNPELFDLERRYGRSLFGAHLDDFVIRLQDVKSKHYASRGQQKLIALLIKIAQIQELSAQRGGVIFLLDDFMTDFDAQRANIFLDILLQLKGQLIFTTPVNDGFFREKLNSVGAQYISLTD
jgi:DNA replication and repair protein RecF